MRHSKITYEHIVLIDEQVTEVVVVFATANAFEKGASRVLEGVEAARAAGKRVVVVYEADQRRGGAADPAQLAPAKTVPGLPPPSEWVAWQRRAALFPATMERVMKASGLEARPPPKYIVQGARGVEDVSMDLAKSKARAFELGTREWLFEEV